MGIVKVIDEPPEIKTVFDKVTEAMLGVPELLEVV